MKNKAPDDSSVESVYERPLIKLMMSVGAAELTSRQWNVLVLIISHTFHGGAPITPKFISLKAFENHTRYKSEVIQPILELLIANRLVFRTYPDGSGLPFYAVNPDSNDWTVWEDSPAPPLSPSDRDSQDTGEPDA